MDPAFSAIIFIEKPGPGTKTRLLRHDVVKQAIVVARLPKTRSGTVLRKTMRTIASGEPYSVPPTIDDPATLDEIAAVLRTLGLAHASTTNIG